MSRGHVARASRRYPDARRRAVRYGRGVRVRRSDLPPHLLPGVTGRRATGGRGQRRLLIVGVQLALLGLLLGLGAFVVSTAAFVSGTVASYRQVNDSLPNAALVAADTFQSTRIVDRNGVLLQEVSDPDKGWRLFVPLDRVSQNLIDATVAAEDATFWTHRGVEPLAILRGVFINVSGSGTSGASTITQQLVRSLYPDEIGNQISLQRKGKEALAAIAIERKYSKRDILTMYVNQIYYGNGAYGIEAAAQTYFSKHASELTLGEAAMLAGLPQAPTYYNPVVNFEVARKRQQYVLNQMVKYKYVTQEQADAAWNEPLHPRGNRSNAVLHAPHFVEYVHEYVEEHYGKDALFRGGLTITTTIDVNLQDRMQQIVREEVDNHLVDYNAHNAAMVVMIPWSGEILAMVGSAGFDDPNIDGQVNVTVSQQQPGSAIKPITYAASFEAGWNPGTVILDDFFHQDTPGADQPSYEPQNYTGMYYGAVPVRVALANSLNIPAVKALQYVGIPHFLDLAHRMGITKSMRHPENYGLAITLGGVEVQPLELTNAYATFANEGKFVPATPILNITDSEGHTVYDLDRGHALQRAPQALKAAYAYQIMTILTDNDSRALVFGRDNLFGQTQQDLGRPTAAKSGTTNDFRDIWTMGYTTDVAIGVWVGNNDNAQMAPIDGITGAGPIWSRAMKELHANPDFAKFLLGPDGQPLPKDFPVPPGIVKAPICTATGGKPTDGSETRDEYLVQGEGPSLRCDQVSAYQASELRYAMADVQRNGGKYTGPGVGSVYRYARAVHFSGGGDQEGGSFIGPQPTIAPARGG